MKEAIKACENSLILSLNLPVSTSNNYKTQPVVHTYQSQEKQDTIHSLGTQYMKKEEPYEIKTSKQSSPKKSQSRKVSANKQK